MGLTTLTVDRLLILLRQVMFDGLLSNATKSDILVWSDKLQRWILVPME